MKIEQTFTIAAPRDAVAAFLLNPQVMLYCVPGVESVTPTDDGRYEATLKAKVGPIRASFAGTVAIDGTASPDLITASGEGRDRSSGSVAQVTLDARLDQTEPNLTTISSTADVTLRGRLGSFGTGVIQSIAGEMIGQFARCVESRVTGTGDSATVPGEVNAPNLAAVAMRGVARGAVQKFGGARRKEEAR